MTGYIHKLIIDKHLQFISHKIFFNHSQVLYQYFDDIFV